MLEILGALATWRASRMISNPREEGPFSAFSLLRQATSQQRNWVERGVWCQMCTSVWAGMLMGWLVDPHAPLRHTFLRGLAYSAVSVVLMNKVG